MKKHLSVLIFTLSIYNLFAASQTYHSGIGKILINGEEKKLNLGILVKLPTNADDLQIVIDSFQIGDTLDYFLKGFDKNPLKSLYPEIRYTNLYGGKYNLEIKVIGQDGAVRHAINTPIIKNELWWEQWQFLVALILATSLAVGVIAFAWASNLSRQKMKEEKLRTQIASDLHDEVGSTLSSISFFTMGLKRKLSTKAPEALETLDDIYDSSNKTIENLRDTVWSINPKNDSFGELLEKMRSFTVQLLSAADINCTIENRLEKQGIDANKLKINPDQRRNVYLMYKEAINNLVKHSKAKNANINIEKLREGILLRIQDDGIGLDLDKNYEGNGLKNFKERAKNSFIDLDIQSQPRQGMIITMLIPEL
jgi:signal transduction histidine kinase